MRYLTYIKFGQELFAHKVDSKEDTQEQSGLFEILLKNSLLHTVNFKRNTQVILYIYKSIVRNQFSYKRRSKNNTQSWCNLFEPLLKESLYHRVNFKMIAQVISYLYKVQLRTVSPIHVSQRRIIMHRLIYTVIHLVNLQFIQLI